VRLATVSFDTVRFPRPAYRLVADADPFRDGAIGQSRIGSNRGLGNHRDRVAIASGAEESVMVKQMSRRQLARSVVGGALAMLMSAAVIFVAARHLAG
jgi:hypothetical protein